MGRRAVHRGAQHRRDVLGVGLRRHALPVHGRDLLGRSAQRTGAEAAEADVGGVPGRDVLQHPAHVRSAGALLRLLGHQRLQHRRQRAGVARLGQRVGDDRRQRRQRRLAAERRLALHRRVQRRTERPQVRLRAGTAAVHTLGGQVVGRADQVAGAGERRVADEGGDAEVGQHDPAGAALQQYVGGLHVAVDHADRVGALQRGEHLRADPRGLARVDHAVLLDQFGQRATVDELHHDPGLAVLLDDVVDGDDARVLDPGGRAGLLLHPRLDDLQVLLGQVPDGELLDRDLAVQHLVRRTPHRAHAAAPKTRAQQVSAREHPALRTHRLPPSSRVLPSVPVPRQEPRYRAPYPDRRTPRRPGPGLETGM